MHSVPPSELVITVTINIVSQEVPPSSVSPSTETPTTSTVTKVLTSTSPTPEGAPGGSNVTSTSAQEADLAVTVVPIVIVCALIGLGGLGAWLFRRRLFKYRMKTTTKDDLRKQSGSGGTILEDPMALQHWRGPRAHSNRYEGWDRETSSITQTPSSGPQPPGKLADRWEFPRHRLKVFNILGEGCFGQVWRCEAQDIDAHETLLDPRFKRHGFTDEKKYNTTYTSLRQKVCRIYIEVEDSAEPIPPMQPNNSTFTSSS
uniref:(California timema) hypothetical protein n=1 Tax=Timema californicum TaxID=61474 RepID=A0A7R9JA00_TIMCA|nr:unnamed protein product [Timema californicum]